MGASPLLSRRVDFSQLVSTEYLDTKLCGLERDGYLSRTITPSIPPSVDYELTELGHDVLVPVKALVSWALSQRERVERAPFSPATRRRHQKRYPEL